MARKQPDNFIICGPIPIDYGSFGVSSKRTKRGKLRKKYTIEIKASPVAVAASALNIGAPLASAMMEALSQRIKSAGHVTASPGTLARRRSWGTTPKSPSAKFRFNAPTKRLTRAQQKENVHLPPAKQHRPQKKKNARDSDPPKPNATGLFNHSGRLREGLTVFRKGARISSSKGSAVWTIAAPANRLHEPSFGARFHEFLNEFNRLVQPQMATQTARYKEAQRKVSSALVKRLEDSLRDKKRMLRVEGVKMAGRMFSAIL